MLHSQHILSGRLLQVFKLNPLLKFALLPTSNNPPPKICCENVVNITFLFRLATLQNLDNIIKLQDFHFKIGIRNT